MFDLNVIFKIIIDPDDIVSRPRLSMDGLITLPSEDLQNTPTHRNHGYILDRMLLKCGHFKEGGGEVNL